MPYTICLECFRRGAEKEGDNHKRDHPYYILDRMDFPVFTQDWSAIDELLLLKGLAQSGIDNWVETSAINSLKTPEECAAHFYGCYYQSREKPKPAPEEVITMARDPTNNFLPVVPRSTVLEQNEAKYQEQLEVVRKEEEQKQKNQKSKNQDDSKYETYNNYSETMKIVGYMPK